MARLPSESEFAQFSRTQLPFSIGVGCLAFFLAIVHPVILSDPWMLSSLALTTFATLLAVVLPRIQIPAAWLSTPPLLDIIAVVLLEMVVIDRLTMAQRVSFETVGFLMLFPVIWMVCIFSRRVAAIVVSASIAVSAFPYTLLHAWPQTPADWAAVILVPLFISGISCLAWLTAIAVRRNQISLAATTRKLHDALDLNVFCANQINATLNAVDVSICHFDTQKRPLLWNTAATTLHHRGGGTGDPSNTPLTRVFEADRVTPVAHDEQILARTFRGDLLSSDISWYGEIGDQRAVIAKSRPVHGLDGLPLGFVVVIHDVTELAESIKVRDDFLSAVSHELKTPLTSILGYLELVEDQLVDTQSGLRIIQRNSERLLSNVENLLTVSRIPVLTLNRLEINASVTAAVERTRPIAFKGNVNIVWEAAEEQYAYIDAAALDEILHHLLDNAIKFSAAERNPSIWVSATRMGDDAIIQVIDTGLGMTSDDKRQMFDKFFRADTARAAALPGAGLGLAIVKSLVEAHGGSVHAKSTVGLGTTVTVALPLTS